MDILLGILMIAFGAAMIYSAGLLARLNVALFKRIFGETGGKFHMWIYRLVGSIFCVLGILIVTGVIKQVGY